MTKFYNFVQKKSDDIGWGLSYENLEISQMSCSKKFL